jgi:hypothetical protein
MTARAELTPDESELKAISGFYPTPEAVIDLMISRICPLKPGDRVLEPSAGKGDIVDRLAALGVRPEVVEPNPRLAAILRSKGYEPFVGRFEDYVTDGAFDKVIMNPPFAGALDFAHIRRAFNLLRPGGILVSLMAEGDNDATSEQKRDFARWLLETPDISSLRFERLDRSLFLTDDAFRPSSTPMQMLSLRKAAVSSLAD